VAVTVLVVLERVAVVCRKLHRNHHHQQLLQHHPYRWINCEKDDHALNENTDSKDDTDNDDRVVMVFLHGLFGHGKNLTTMATKLCQQHNCAGLLIDLLGHGGTVSLTQKQ
jgi:hypothetical protein